MEEEKDKFSISRKLRPLNKSMITNLAKEYGVKIIETNDPVKLYNGIITSGEIELTDKSETTPGVYIMKSRKQLQK